MIGPMRELGRRLLIGLAVAIVAVMAIGYTFIFGGIATPVRADRGVLDLPPQGDSLATILDDGRPIFVVNDPDRGVWVLDAQGRQPASSLGGLVAWCAETRTFVDPADGSTYAPDGELLFGPALGGLVAFATRPATDDPSRIVVGASTSAQGQASAEGARSPACPSDTRLTHAPQAGETFDPSVAADEEPPGWIWLEGTVRVVDGEIQLCDGLTGGEVGCAETVGIDPTAGVEGIRGRFIGRVRDGAIEGLARASDMESGS